MTFKRGRCFQACAVFGAAGAGVVLAAGPAAADIGAPSVSPKTGLHDGQSVTVSWDSGQPYGSPFTGQAVECDAPVAAGETATLYQCDEGTLVNLQAVQAPDGDLEFQGSVTVRKSLDPANGPATCTNQCSIVIFIPFGSAFAYTSGSVPISFK
jgi:hypothetical protein